MSSFRGSPRLIKGALVGVDAMNLLATVAVSQYNSDSLARPESAKAPRSTGSEDYNSSFSWSTDKRACLRI